MLLYVWSRDPSGRLFWNGPFTEAQIRGAVASGQLAENVLLCWQDGVQLLGSAFAPQPESPLRTAGKFLLWAGAAFAAVKVAGAVVERFTSTEEQRSIRQSAKNHERRGADVCADHVNWGCVPPLMGRRRADVVADYGTWLVVEEHETRSSVNRTHSREQDRDLRQWARRRKRVLYRQVIAG